MTLQLFCSNIPQIHQNNDAMWRFQYLVYVDFNKQWALDSQNRICSLQLIACHCIIIHTRARLTVSTSILMLLVTTFAATASSATITPLWAAQNPHPALSASVLYQPSVAMRIMLVSPVISSRAACQEHGTTFNVNYLPSLIYRITVFQLFPSHH